MKQVRWFNGSKGHKNIINDYDDKDVYIKKEASLCIESWNMFKEFSLWRQKKFLVVEYQKIWSHNSKPKTFLSIIEFSKNSQTHVHKINYQKFPI